MTQPKEKGGVPPIEIYTIVKAGADIHAGDGGYNIGTQEKYDEFVKVRNKSLNKITIKGNENTNKDIEPDPVKEQDSKNEDDEFKRIEKEHEQRQKYQSPNPAIWP